MISKIIICEYCNTQNPSTAKSCLACGAPLEFRSQPAETISAQKSRPSIQPKPESQPEEDLRKVGEKVDQAYTTALNTYATLWRTLAEAIAIAVTGFIIGVAGGATRMGWFGVLGAILVGIAVGMTQKNFYLVLLSAPGGAFIGLGIGTILSIAGLPWALSMIVTASAVFGAMVGGARRPVFQHRIWWEKLRPILGALGGFLFGLLGLFLGSGIHWIGSLFR